MPNDMVVFAGRSNPGLFQECFTHNKLDAMFDYPALPSGGGEISQFSDGELFFQFKESVRGMDCYILQSTCFPHNDNLMELCVMTDALKRGSAASVTAVFPYFGYARQDRQATPRTPITAKLVANLIAAAGVDRVVLMDIHSTQTQGFFTTPLVDVLQASPILINHIWSNYRGWFPDHAMIVSPDVGGVKRARNFSKKLGCGLAIIDKRRDKPNESEVMNLIGDVTGKNCLLVDDMVDTAGTLCQSANALKEAGAKDIIACATHPVLSGPALERIAESALSRLIVTDSIPLTQAAAANPKISVVSCARLLKNAIHRIHRGLSVSEIFA